MDRAAFKEHIIREEGARKYAYRDTEGFWTIGYGFLIDEKKGGEGLPDGVANFWLNELVDRVIKDMERVIPFWDDLSDARQQAVAGMAYQMGVSGLLGFRNMLQALQDQDWDRAADEALDSKWARQTPARAERVAAMIRVG